MEKVQIIEQATGRVTREEWAGGLALPALRRLVNNLESAVRNSEPGRYRVNLVVADDYAGPTCRGFAAPGGDCYLPIGHPGRCQYDGSF